MCTQQQNKYCALQFSLVRKNMFLLFLGFKKYTSINSSMSKSNMCLYTFVYGTVLLNELSGKISLLINSINKNPQLKS